MGKLKRKNIRILGHIFAFYKMIRALLQNMFHKIHRYFNRNVNTAANCVIEKLSVCPFLPLWFGLAVDEYKARNGLETDMGIFYSPYLSLFKYY